MGKNYKEIDFKTLKKDIKKRKKALSLVTTLSTVNGNFGADKIVVSLNPISVESYKEGFKFFIRDDGVYEIIEEGI